MQVTTLVDKQAQVTLSKLISDCISFNVAVAWATQNSVVEKMLKYHQKIDKMVIGTHMYLTDPAVLRSFMSSGQVRYLLPVGKLFHPKVYLFKLTGGYAAVVGSHNLTNGAFGDRNIEMSMLIEGRGNEKIFRDLAIFIGEYWKKATPIKDDNKLFSYEAQYRKNIPNHVKLDNFTLLKKPRSGSKLTLIDTTWPEFVSAIRNDPHQNLQGRLLLLESALRLFEEHSSFQLMSQFHRKAIAGTYGEVEPQHESLNWAWFGRMFGHGDFKNLINDYPNDLSAALKKIPLYGSVSESDYYAFVELFRMAFKDKTRKGGVPTASRLLTMLRPDIFVCINGANDTRLCNALGAAKSTLNLENYWERIIIPIQNSTWWLHPRPRSIFLGRIWDNRAALLDCIYYST